MIMRREGVYHTPGSMIGTSGTYERYPQRGGAGRGGAAGILGPIFFSGYLSYVMEVPIILPGV